MKPLMPKPNKILKSEDKVIEKNESKLLRN